jgi:hypothetical protein
MPTGTQVGQKIRQVATNVRGERDAEMSFFDVQVTLASGGNNEQTTIIPDRVLNSNEKLYLYGWGMTSDGAVWTTGTNVSIQSSDGLVTFATVTQANLPTTTVAVGQAGGTNYGTLTAGLGMITGATLAKGIKLVRSGDFAGTPIITLRVWGVIRTVNAETFN